MTESEKGRIQIYDVVIIGAGLYGIQAARYYLDIHPNERIYEAFWTQTPVGMAEFSDRPMAPPPDGNQCYRVFPTRYVTKYLESYIDNHVYNETTIRDRIMFNTQVIDLKNTADGL
ncbi:hypothetical protein ABVK25_010301 [Lepraria finkii]|uniref:Uncharacterized protein n=1 Tax=Lepraria finkii TaxID=1340010 RepID=A0ABR4AWU0_9LECA